MIKKYFLLVFIITSTISKAQEPFITTWEVESEDLEITIPVMPGLIYDYEVDFGDGVVTSNVTGSISHTYNAPGIYTVAISGDFPAIYAWALDENDSNKLKSIDQWGDIQWGSMSAAFAFCRNLVINATDSPDLSQVTNMSSMFWEAESMNQNINQWDVSNITNMSWMFKGAHSFNQPLNNWDVSNVTNMNHMFGIEDVSFNVEDMTFNHPLDSWNTSSVTDMEHMFHGATAFNQPIDSWDVSNVTDMSYMFTGAVAFNQPIDSWDVSNVHDMEYMFIGAVAFNQDLNNWNVSNVTDMKYMFNGAVAFNQPLNNWNVSNVTDMEYMFYGAVVFNQPLNNWDVSGVTTMAGMFRGAIAFNQPLNNWNTSNVTQMYSMFEDASSFNQPLDNWDTSNVESMSEMFKNASSFNGPIGTWNLSSIEQDAFGNGIDNMFNGASSFNQPLNSWDVSAFTDLTSLFRGATAFNQPLDSWNVSNVMDMNSLFKEASSFNQPLNNWNVSNVTDMTGLFQDAASFNQPLSSWNINSGISSMMSMFEGASNFNQPLDNWDVSNVPRMNRMFQDASSFNQDLGSWDVSNVSYFSNMFKNAHAFDQPLNTWDFSEMNTYLPIDGLYGFISNTSMSIENYDALLQHLTTFDIENVYLGADGLEYCDEASVEYLTTQLNWTIYDDGQALCNTVTGSVYFDHDNNGCDATDIEVSNNFIFFENTENLNVYAKQIINGNYSGGLSGTNFTASIQGLPDFMTANPVDAMVDFSGGSTNETLDFCLTANQAVDDLSVTLIPISEARPGFESTYQLIVENIGTESISNVVVNLSFDDTMQSFVSATPTPDVSTSDNLQFNFAVINPFQSETIDIIQQIFTPPIVNHDDLLQFNAIVLPDGNDYTPDNNSYNLDQIVVNSFDPNDINVLQGETITIDQTGDYLDYIIRFQNTGTASAINVEVQSLLHQNLNASTFRVLSSSHNYVANIENNIITFEFDNINLPDETTDPQGSNGFIAYRLKPKTGIQIGEIVEGIAAIVFDFNEPIITNTVNTEVVEPLNIDDFSIINSLTIYPNPANDFFKIGNPSNLSIKAIQLYDISGNFLKQFSDSENYEIYDLPSGVYFLKIKTDKTETNKKIIKL